MKYLKSFSIFENDSNLSDMTVINKSADKTIVDQEREQDGNSFQKLSSASKIKNNTKSTYVQNSQEEDGNYFQKLSKDSAIEVEPSKSKPTVDNTYQKLQSTSSVSTDAEEVVKLSTRPENGDDFQDLSDAPEKDNVGSTYKLNVSSQDQNLSEIGESFKHLKRF